MLRPLYYRVMTTFCIELVHHFAMTYSPQSATLSVLLVGCSHHFHHELQLCPTAKNLWLSGFTRLVKVG